MLFRRLSLLVTGLAGLGYLWIHAATVEKERLAIEQGVAVAENLAHHNGPILATGGNNELDILPASKQVGVLEALITGSQGFVKAPAAKRGRSLSRHPLYKESFTSRRPATRMHDGNLEVMAPVIASIQGMRPGIVGYTFLVYDTKKVVESLGIPLQYPINKWVGR